ncbi:MAG: MFS transporter [Chloroflexi bacterium]|nr:MFS transporter [Chloroflexota bacterium]
MESKTEVVGLRSLPKQQITITMAGVLLAMFMSSLDQTIVGTAMPRIIADLGGFTQYTWITTAYLLTSTVVLPIVGKLTDMYGRKWFYTVGLIIFVFGSLLCGLSQTMTQLIFFRAFQGIGAGILMANTFIVIGDLFPPAERGKYQGLISGVFGLSYVIGPTLGGFITDRFSWHWIFYINVPLGLLVIILFIFFFPHLRPDRIKHQLDYAGITLLVLATVSAMLAMTWGNVQYPWLSVPIISMFIFSAIMAALFIMVERRSPEPILPLSLFSNRIVNVSILSVFFTGIGMFGSIVFVPLFFQGVLGLSATASGNFMMPMMLGTVFGSFVSGQALSRAGGHYRIQGMFGLSIMALGMGLLTRMTPETTYTTAIIDVILVGFGLGTTFPLYTIAVQNAVPYKFMGVATSSTVFFRSLGASFGLAVLGSVMSNRFVAEFTGQLPPAVLNAVPRELLSSLARNPQALVSPEAQTQLQNLLSQAGPQGAQLFEQVLQALRQALSSALITVFFIGLIIILIAFVINLFNKEIPLRRHHHTTDE